MIKELPRSFASGSLAAAAKKTSQALKDDDPSGGEFALFLHPLPGAFRQLMCSHPGEFAHFFKEIANAGGLARVGGGMGTAGID